ncbi:transposase, IS4 family [Ancylostoma caninum]|uniref:Transposase, IS4 family n=1 Tax=Ancylostoma caninum TaxID=29170 RepID=A0A368H6R0_ANCCA|nr:transposase, IS4 family [Ancylostoma caninum]
MPSENWRTFALLLAAVLGRIRGGTLRLNGIRMTRSIIMLLFYLYRMRNTRIRSTYISAPHRRRLAVRFDTFENYFNDVEKFMEYTRLTPEEFEYIHHRVQHRLTHKRTHLAPIEPRYRLAICLRYLGHGSSFGTHAHEFKLGRTTVMQVVYETCSAIIEEFWEEAFPRPTATTWLESARGFKTKCGYPRAVAAIDGKHFKIFAPPRSGSSYYCYKAAYSVVLLAVVDAYYRVVLFDVGAKGRSCDAGILRTSPLRGYLEEANNQFPMAEPLMVGGETVEYHVLADGGFAQTTLMQTPFNQAEAAADPIKANFNRRFSGARRIVENVFGILATRFRIFHQVMQGLPDNITLMIRACLVLHNLLVNTTPPDQLMQRFPPLRDGENSHRYRSQARPRTEALRQRMAVANFLAQEEGLL